MKKTVIVTGGAGYLGSVLCGKLLENGYMVKCIDKIYYGLKGIEELIENENFTFIKDNVASIAEHAHEFDDCYGVVHMAELSNDPSCDLDPELTELFNYKNLVTLLSFIKKYGIERFVFTSSCSVYGKGLN